MRHPSSPSTPSTSPSLAQTLGHASSMLMPSSSGEVGRSTPPALPTAVPAAALQPLSDEASSRTAPDGLASRPAGLSAGPAATLGSLIGNPPAAAVSTAAVTVGGRKLDFPVPQSERSVLQLWTLLKTGASSPAEVLAEAQKIKATIPGNENDVDKYYTIRDVIRVGILEFSTADEPKNAPYVAHMFYNLAKSLRRLVIKELDLLHPASAAAGHPQWDLDAPPIEVVRAQQGPATRQSTARANVPQSSSIAASSSLAGLRERLARSARTLPPPPTSTPSADPTLLGDSTVAVSAGMPVSRDVLPEAQYYMVPKDVLDKLVLLSERAPSSSATSGSIDGSSSGLPSPQPSMLGAPAFPFPVTSPPSQDPPINTTPVPGPIGHNGSPPRPLTSTSVAAGDARPPPPLAITADHPAAQISSSKPGRIVGTMEDIESAFGAGLSSAVVVEEGSTEGSASSVGTGGVAAKSGSISDWAATSGSSREPLPEFSLPVRASMPAPGADSDVDQHLASDSDGGSSTGEEDSSDLEDIETDEEGGVKSKKPDEDDTALEYRRHASARPMDEMATDGHEVVNEEEEDDLCDLTIVHGGIIDPARASAMSTSASSVSVDDQYVEEDSLFGNYGRGLPGAYANDSLLDADDELGPHPEEEDSAVGSLPSARSPPRGTMEDSTVTLEAMAQGVAESEVADLQAILLRQEERPLQSLADADDVVIDADDDVDQEDTSSPVRMTSPPFSPQSEGESTITLSRAPSLANTPIAAGRPAGRHRSSLVQIDSPGNDDTPTQRATRSMSRLSHFPSETPSRTQLGLARGPRVGGAGADRAAQDGPALQSGLSSPLAGQRAASLPASSTPELPLLSTSDARPVLRAGLRSRSPLGSVSSGSASQLASKNTPTLADNGHDNQPTAAAHGKKTARHTRATSKASSAASQRSTSPAGGATSGTADDFAGSSSIPPSFTLSGWTPDEGGDPSSATNDSESVTSDAPSMRLVSSSRSTTSTASGTSTRQKYYSKRPVDTATLPPAEQARLAQMYSSADQVLGIPTGGYNFPANLAIKHSRPKSAAPKGRSPNALYTTAPAYSDTLRDLVPPTARLLLTDIFPPGTPDKERETFATWLRKLAGVSSGVYNDECTYAAPLISSAFSEETVEEIRKVATILWRRALEGYRAGVVRWISKRENRPEWTTYAHVWGADIEVIRRYYSLFKAATALEEKFLQMTRTFP